MKYSYDSAQTRAQRAIVRMIYKYRDDCHDSRRGIVLMCEDLGMCYHTLRDRLHKPGDFKLSEMERIAELFGIPVYDLLKSDKSEADTAASEEVKFNEQ